MNPYDFHLIFSFKGKITRPLFLSVITLFLFFSAVPMAWAEEHGGGEGKSSGEHGGGGEGAEGGKGEHGGESKGGGFIKKDEYLELNASVEQINAKIKAKRESLKKLLQEKEEIKEPKAFRETVKQIEKEYKELKALTENIEKKKAIIRFRFPDRGFVKQKNKIKLDSIEEIGVEGSIDKELDQAVEIMRTQYGHLLNTQRNKKREPAHEKDDDHQITRLPSKEDHEVKKVDPLVPQIPTPDDDPTGTVILRK